MKWFQVHHDVRSSVIDIQYNVIHSLLVSYFIWVYYLLFWWSRLFSDSKVTVHRIDACSADIAMFILYKKICGTSVYCYVIKNRDLNFEN